MADNGGRRGIQSVEIGMRVLAAVAEMPGASSLSSIAQRAAISSSQTHRYLSSLMAAGMVLQEGRSGHYDLASGAIRIGLAALSRIDAFASADEIMKQLVIDTRRTALIAVWGDAGPTIVRWYAGSPPLLTPLTIGSNLPLLRSATGRVFYAYGEQIEMDRQARLIEISDPASMPSNIEKLRDSIRNSGRAGIMGDVIPGLRASAAPILDLQGNLIMVATQLAGVNFPESGDAAAGEALVNACQRISASVGGRPALAATPPVEPVEEAPRRGPRGAATVRPLHPEVARTAPRFLRRNITVR
jgi:DNA-binding IclR family transcriptional regulator